MLPTKVKRVSFSRIVGLIISIVLLAASIWVVFNRYYVYNVMSAWRFTPSSDMRAVTERLALTSSGTLILNATHPQIQDAESFNQSCPNQEQSAAVIGCYQSGKTYIYNVTDARLNGIREVTAAHEMLHAVYEQLGTKDRERIDTLVEAEYAKPAIREQLQTKIAIYDKTEPTERDNELHSILGTEVANLSPELETHYRQYMTDRTKILGYHDAYQELFNSLSDQSEKLTAEINNLSAKINAASDKYNADTKVLNLDIAAFNQRANASSFRSQSEFSSERNALAARTAQLEADRTAINNDIATYNSKLKEYQSISIETNSLNKSINSNTSPAPSVEQ